MINYHTGLTYVNKLSAMQRNLGTYVLSSCTCFWTIHTHNDQLSSSNHTCPRVWNSKLIYHYSM